MEAEVVEERVMPSKRENAPGALDVNSHTRVEEEVAEVPKYSNRIELFHKILFHRNCDLPLFTELIYFFIHFFS